MSNTAMDVIYLASCAVNDTVPEKVRVEQMDLEAVYALGSRHMITAAVAFALETAGFKDKRSGSAIAAAIAMGGNVRVGFEDNLYLSKGVLAKSNGELVEKVVRLANELGRPIATSDEAREILGLKKR